MEEGHAAYDAMAATLDAATEADGEIELDMRVRIVDGDAVRAGPAATTAVAGG